MSNLAVVTCAAISTGVQVFLHRLTTFLLDILAGVETLDYMYGESISSFPRRLHSVLRMTMLIYLPIDNI